MAFIDGNHGSSVKIARYRYLLNTLEKKTGESKERIGDTIAFVMKNLKQEKGIEVTLLALLEGVNRSFPSNSTLTFTEVLAAHAALIEMGWYRP